jgi:hypothetical protein
MIGRFSRRNHRGLMGVTGALIVAARATRRSDG